MKLSDQLDAIALGNSYSSQALFDAMNHPCVTSNDSQILSRYIWGTETSTDHIELQQIAIYIRESGD